MSNPGVDRTVRILEFLASHPGQLFTVSELSRRLNISKSTALTVVNALVEHGYLVRDPSTQRYTLGPAVVPLGASGEGQHAALRLARVEAERLSDSLGTETFVTWATKLEIVVVAHVPGLRGGGSLMKPGQRLPLVPPIGMVFLAWASDREIDDYLDRRSELGLPIDADLYRQALGLVRERGYWIAYPTDASARLRRLHEEGEEIHAEPAQAQLREVLADFGELVIARPPLAESEKARVSHLSAPIFGPDARVAFGLSVSLGWDWLTDGDIREIAGRLLRSADDVTRATNGQRPPVSVARRRREMAL